MPSLDRQELAFVATERPYEPGGFVPRGVRVRAGRVIVDNAAAADQFRRALVQLYGDAEAARFFGSPTESEALEYYGYRTTRNRWRRYLSALRLELREGTLSGPPPIGFGASLSRVYTRARGYQEASTVGRVGETSEGKAADYIPVAADLELEGYLAVRSRVVQLAGGRRRPDLAALLRRAADRSVLKLTPPRAVAMTSTGAAPRTPKTQEQKAGFITFNPGDLARPRPSEAAAPVGVVSTGAAPQEEAADVLPKVEQGLTPEQELTERQRQLQVAKRKSVDPGLTAADRDSWADIAAALERRVVELERAIRATDPEGGAQRIADAKAKGEGQFEDAIGTPTSTSGGGGLLSTIAGWFGFGSGGDPDNNPWVPDIIEDNADSIKKALAAGGASMAVSGIASLLLLLWLVKMTGRGLMTAAPVAVELAKVRAGVVR